MGISALISLISRKIQRSMPERACPSSSGGCLRDAPALRELGTRQERDVELGSGAARLHRELPRGSRGARARLTPLCSRAPLLLPTQRHVCSSTQVEAPSPNLPPGSSPRSPQLCKDIWGRRRAAAAHRLLSKSTRAKCFVSTQRFASARLLLLPRSAKGGGGASSSEGQRCGILGLREIKPRGFRKRAFPPSGLGAVGMGEAPTQGQQQPPGFVFPGAPLCSQSRSPAALLLPVPIPGSELGASRGEGGSLIPALKRGGEALSDLPKVTHNLQPHPNPRLRAPNHKVIVLL